MQSAGDSEDRSLSVNKKSIRNEQDRLIGRSLFRPFSYADQ